MKMFPKGDASGMLLVGMPDALKKNVRRAAALAGRSNIPTAKLRGTESKHALSHRRS